MERIGSPLVKDFRTSVHHFVCFLLEALSSMLEVAAGGELVLLVLCVPLDGASTWGWDHIYFCVDTVHAFYTHT